MISVTFSMILACAFLWTTAFSLTNKFPVRGLRNLGIMGCYLVGIGMFFVAGVKSAASTWVMFGLLGGLLYFLYDVAVWFKAKPDQKKPPVSLKHFVNGQLAWPIMGPEAIEYLLAELGVLQSAAQPVPEDRGHSQPGGGEERR